MKEKEAEDKEQQEPPVTLADDNLNEEGKTISYRYPRYEKRSLLTVFCAIFLPSAGYAIWRYFPLSEPGKLFENIFESLRFSSYAWATAFYNIMGLPVGPGMLFFAVLQLSLVVFLHKYVKWTPRKALTIAVCVGMGSLFLINIMEYMVRPSVS